LITEDGREHDASLVVHLSECISAESDHGFLVLNLSFFHAECKVKKIIPFSSINFQNFPQKVINRLCGYLQGVFGNIHEIFGNID
ncbi:MAG: hypothetical protein J6P75_10305, partial [Bacteroidales bacterium]|nr:hypothetical protein [Bacteroidales bacterium]